MTLHRMLTNLFGRLDPERAHRLAIRLLAAGLAPRRAAPALPVTAMGLRFPNPVGLAAGFDKNAEAADALLGLGFGFVEVGTLTPRPQAGNPKPRLFRLAEDRAAINRMGFNNDGFDAARRRLATRDRGRGIVGVNLGANRDAADPVADYAAGVRTFAPLADYLVANVSSPNTPGLRDLQAADRLNRLLGTLTEARAQATGAGRYVPLVLKIAPDLDHAALHDIANAVLAHGVDAVAISNTTIARDGLQSRHAGQSGGLSGRPLLQRSTDVLGRFHRLTDGRLPLIGVGGVESGDTAYAKLRQGASLVQLYTALVYEGPGLPGRIVAELAALLARDGWQRVADAVGAGHR